MKTTPVLFVLRSMLLLLFMSIQFSACAQPQQAAEQTAATPSVPAEKISDYVRKKFNVPADVQITVKDTPSSVPGLKSIELEFTGQRGSQKQQAWITSDNKLLVGQIFDLSADPYKANMDKVKLENVPLTGAANAKVTIVEYSDFQCPFCSQAHKTVDELMKTYGGKVKLLYKHLPLNIHNWAEDAAVASACVHQQNNDAFWKVYDYLFTNQNAITKETVNAKVMEVAKQSNLNAEQLQTCINTKATINTVKDNINEATALNIQSTPTFIVNGRMVVGALPMDQFKKVIDEALTAAN